ncbi:MAG: nickel pincer cofactor biosynthesis protein LarC [Planctomycetota bacterium]|jgi:hypothetical protein|nr:nickel pincer cofactor biosynthesis protein LarC [Planctomycetota bacterium]
MHVYLNLFGGVAGDMLVAALYQLALNANISLKAVDDFLAALPFDGVDCKFETSKRQGIEGVNFSVNVSLGQPHRHLSDVVEIIEQLNLSEDAKSWSLAAFEILADAEAKVHGTSREQVHFHEVGAVDSIIDICLSSLLLDLLQPSRIYCSPISVGSGKVECDHGQMPVPAPATQELLLGLPSCGFELTGERATPTGLALLRAWQVDFSVRSAAVCLEHGYGVGDHDFSDRANLIRANRELPATEAECVVELRTMVDDQSGEVIGHAIESLRQQDTIEAYLLPVMAKQSRPGFEVVVICDISKLEFIKNQMFELLGTLGIRETLLKRHTLARVEDRASALNNKIRFYSDSSQILGAKPEFRDVVEMSEQNDSNPRAILNDLNRND